MKFYLAPTKHMDLIVRSMKGYQNGRVKTVEGDPQARGVLTADPY